jgi:hypothetical protein
MQVGDGRYVPSASVCTGLDRVGWHKSDREEGKNPCPSSFIIIIIIIKIIITNRPECKADSLTSIFEPIVRKT